MTQQTERLPESQTREDEASLPREAFGALVGQYEATLYNIAVAILGNRADCQDAMQEAVLAAWRSLASLREPRYFKTWLTRILVNKCRRALRRRGSLPAPLPEELPAPNDEETRLLRAAVDGLPAHLRPVVVLYYYEDFSVQEIARTLGLPRGTVQSRLARGRDALRRALL